MLCHVLLCVVFRCCVDVLCLHVVLVASSLLLKLVDLTGGTSLRVFLSDRCSHNPSLPFPGEPTYEINLESDN